MPDSAPSPLRVACAQVAFRLWTDLDAFAAHIDGFVASAAALGARLIVFPEWFSVGLTARTPTLRPEAAIRTLAADTEPLLERLSRSAAAREMWIAAGSAPQLHGARLLNVATLLGPAGARSDQAKLHPTPDERDLWRVEGGDTLQAVDTPLGRVATLVCYDVEFPELARRAADQDARLLLVPYATDTRAGHLRVTLCARARAVENQIYVAAAGNVGHAPSIPNMETHAAASAAYTPCDHGFARDGIAVEAPENVEALVTADLDLAALERARRTGSVRPIADRRRDLYETVWLNEARR